ncbi:MAG: glycosyltransferase family 2 protein [Oscillibacter sp.]|nr:glycosyltransferase family 2 protein [Oscillibacter sp.]
MKTLVIIPAWNEEDNLLNTVRDLQENGEKIDLLVVNDCSTDGTAALLRENGIPFLDLPVNLGIGGGVQSGYRYALERGYDIAVQFDGDGQHMGAYLSALLAPIQAGRADYTIGSRFLEGEGFQSSALRRLGIRFLSGLIDALCGVKVLDATSGMRAVNRDLIALFAADYPQDYPEPEAILAAGLRGYRVEEVPVRMRERQGGVSSINPVRSVYYMIKVSLALVLSRAMAGKGGGR